MKNMTIKVSSEVDQAIENYQAARRKLDGKITGKAPARAGAARSTH
jgi:hypothetical protein